jgi:hypothetical protein
MGRFTKKFDKSYDFSNVALFPWTHNSLDTLWDGEYTDREANEWTEWESVVGDLYGAIAGVGNHKLHVKTHKYKYSVDLPEQKVYSGLVLPFHYLLTDNRLDLQAERLFVCVGSDEPFPGTTSLQRWKCATHS